MAHCSVKGDGRALTGGRDCCDTTIKDDCTVAYVDCCAKGSCVKLNDRYNPFRTADDAIVTWYEHTTGSCKKAGDPLYPTTQTLVVYFVDCCVQELQLERYVNITFTKATNRPLDVILVTRVNSSLPSVVFDNVTFDSINHTVLLTPGVAPLAGTTQNTVNPVQYQNVTKYTPTSTLQHIIDISNNTANFVATSNTGVAVPASNRLTAGTPSVPLNRYLRSSQRTQASATPVTLTRLAMPFGVSAATAMPLGQSSFGNLKAFNALNALQSSPREHQDDRSHSPRSTPLPRPTTVFAVILPGSAVLVDGPYSLAAAGVAVIGFINGGVLNLNFDSAEFESGMLVDGTGATMIYNTPENSQGSLNIRYPQLSALIAGRGSKRLLNARLIVANSSVGFPDNDNIISPTNDERNARVNNNPFNSRTKMFLFKNDDSNATTLNTNEPYNEISQSTINACAISETTPVFATDSRNARISYDDLICVHLITEDNDRVNPGPIFSIYSSSSLVTNGSTFLLPVTIRHDYVHARLDGTIFYIDAEDGDRRDARFSNANLSSANLAKSNLAKLNLECSDKCKPKKLTIDLPGRCDWNGRVITYIRIDCSSTEVILRSDGRIQGHKPGRLCIRPNEAITLHNRDGNYWAVSHLH